MGHDGDGSTRVPPADPSAVPLVPVVPLVSVVLPLHDARRYIAEAVASVQAQSVRDWELVVVDDHSADGSAEVVASFQRDDPRIRVVRPDAPLGRGSRARNAGIAAARGRFVAFLDHDDRWHPDHLRLLLEAFDHDPDAVLVAANARVIDGAGKLLSASFWDPPARLSGEELRRLVLGGPVTRTMSAVVARKELFDRHGVRLDEEMRAADDWALFVETAVARRLPVVILAVATADWRYHGANTMSSVDAIADSCREQQRVLARLSASPPSEGHRLTEAEATEAARYRAGLSAYAANTLVVAGRFAEALARYDEALALGDALPARRRRLVAATRAACRRVPRLLRLVLRQRGRRGPVPPRRLGGADTR